MAIRQPVSDKDCDCYLVTSVDDVTNEYNDIDKHPLGTGDDNLIGCGKDGSYNELQNIYDKKLAKYVAAGRLTEEEAIYMLCMACKVVAEPRTRKEFYTFLSDSLSIPVKV